MQIFHHDQPIEIQSKEAFDRFARDFRIIHAAGGIVHNDANEILMIFRLGKWDFPKGKVEEGEQWAEAALREVQEETGLHNITLGEPLPSTFHTYELRGEPILKETHWYAMQAPKQPLTPQTAEDISQAVWVPFGEVDIKMQNSYPSLTALWREVSDALTR
ncbi:MAG: NUDIX domain-containing protein [Bacteroidales bacterium]|nr:NUDIX domain-containing protein [Bacteroidales bacterium]MBR6161367.1 NUDIX domain-containing protein [Bacteroidales bacterium]